MTNNIYKMVQEHVEGLFETHKKPKLVFHSLAHTEEIVKRSEEIAAHYKLSEKEIMAVYIAAWFHDTGHLFTTAVLHEAKSVELMKSFMEVHQPDPALISLIEGCILATKRSTEPVTLLQQIICDADTYHLGTKDFKKTNKQVRKEMMSDQKDLSKTDYDLKTLEFLENHRYYTTYCIELLTKGKQENIDRLRHKVIENTVDNDVPTIFSVGKDDNKQTKQDAGLISKGIQTMLRLASTNHLRLSEMADRKANILISVNAIIISVSISVLFRKFETDPFLVIPTIIFLTSSVVTIVLSILATRPTVSGGKFTKEDITNKKTNLLFFGNFYKATLEDYNWGMSIMMRDTEYLYGSLIKDVYYLGVVLGKKYKLLRIAYNIFMAGIVISVIAFTIAVFTKSPETTTVITTPTSSPL